MNADDQICYCYHVPLRKLVNFARRERPQKPSQMSNCLGAGTGCGWCIPILMKIHASITADPESEPASELPDNAQSYADGRKSYLKSESRNSFDG